MKLKGGSKEKAKKGINNISKRNETIGNELKDFNTYLNLYLNTQKKIEDNYIINTNKFLNDLVKIIVKSEKPKKFEIDYNIDRLFILNYIYNFSVRDSDSGKLNQGLFSNKDTNMLFYFKKRKLQRFNKKPTDKSYIKGYYKNNPETLWFYIGVLREYEFKMEKAFCLFKESILNIRDDFETTKSYLEERIGSQTGEEKDKVENKKKILEIKFDDEQKKYEEYKLKSVEPIKLYNENLKKTNPVIHYYIKDISLKNINLLMLNDFNKLFKDKIFRKKNKLKKDKSEEYKLYMKSNNLIFGLGNEMLKIFFKKIGEMYDKDSINYYDNFHILHYLTLKFHEINTLFIFRPNIMPYIDIGQPSMMTYETFLYNNPKNVLTKKFTNQPYYPEPTKDYVNLNQIRTQDNYKDGEKRLSKKIITRGEGNESSIKKKMPLSIYITHSNYYNNILTLPHYMINHLKLLFLKQNEKDAHHEHIKKTISDYDLKKKSDENIGGIKNFEEALGSKNLDDDVNLNLTINKIDIKSKKGLNFNNVSKKEEIDISEKEKKKEENFFIPLSSIIAMFSINDMNKAGSLSYFTRESGFAKLKPNQISKNFDSLKEWTLGYKKNNILEVLKDDIFHINSTNHIILGTYQFLYKRISFLTHFLLNKDTELNYNFTSLSETFLDKSFFDYINFFSKIDKENANNKDLKEKMKKNIQNNTGIYNGVNSRKNYYMYAMLVYSEHLLKLVEYVNELEYLSEKIEFYSFRSEGGTPVKENKFMEEYKKIKEQIKTTNLDESVHDIEVKSVSNIKKKLEELLEGSDIGLKNTIIEELSDQNKVFTEGEFLNDNDKKAFSKKLNTTLESKVKFQRFNYYINLIFYNGKKPQEEIETKIKDLIDDKKTRGDESINLTFKDFLIQEGVDSRTIDSMEIDEIISLDSIYLENKENVDEFYNDYLKSNFQRKIVVQKILNGLTKPIPKIDTLVTFLGDGSISVDKFEDEIIFHFIKNNLNIISNSDEDSIKIKEFEKERSNSDKKLNIDKILKKGLKNLVKDTAKFTNQGLFVQLYDDIENILPSERKEIFVDKKILFNNVSFFKPSLLIKFKKYLENTEIKYTSNGTSITKFREKVKTTKELLDKVIDQNNININEYGKSLIKNKKQNLYVIKKDEQNISLEYVKEKDEDKKLEEQYINNKGKNPTLDSGDNSVKSGECFNKYEFNKEIKVDKFVEDLDDYVLYNPEFYGENAKLIKNIKKIVEDYNKEMVLVSLYIDILENKNKGAGTPKGTIDTGTGTASNKYIPYQYLLLNNIESKGKINENKYLIEPEAIKKSGSNGVPYNKFIFELRPHKYFDELKQLNKEENSDESFEYYNIDDSEMKSAKDIKKRFKNYDTEKKPEKKEKKRIKMERILKGKTTKIPEFMQKNIYKNKDILSESNTSFSDFISNLNKYKDDESNNDNNDNDDNNENAEEYTDDTVKSIINNFEVETKKILENTLKRIVKYFYLVPYNKYRKIKDI